MSKSILFLLLVGFTCLFYGFTNPRIEHHKAAVKEKLTAYWQKSLKQNGIKAAEAESGPADPGTLVGRYGIDKLIEGGVTRRNYLLFSTTDFTAGGEAKVIGFGVLGTVFITSPIEEVVKSDKP